MKKSAILVATTIITIILLSTIVMATGDITQITDTNNSTNTDMTSTLMNNAITAYDNSTTNENTFVDDSMNVLNQVLDNSVDANSSPDLNNPDSNATQVDNTIPIDNLPTSDTTSSSGLDTGNIINIFMIVVGIVIILLGFAILIRSK